MYRSILVPLDGSPLSEQALPTACSLARRSKAALQLVHIHTRYDADPIVMEGVPIIDEEMHSLGKEHERAYLEAVRDRLAAEGELSITVAVLDSLEEDGNDPSCSAMIAGYAARNNADLIVMTTHGRGGLERFWLGSVADQLVRTSSVPVLLIHPGKELQQAPVSSLQRILIPLDGSELAEQILEPVSRLGRDTNAVYTLVHIVETESLGRWGLPTLFHDLYTERIHEQQAKARAYLEQVAEGLRSDGFTVETYIRVAEQVAPAILNVAHDDGSDLIAIATHGRSGFTRLLIGSVADKMVRATDMPMFVYRPQRTMEDASKAQ